MKKIQLLMLLIVIFTGCNMAQTRPAVGAYPPRRRAPLQLSIPESKSQPQTIVNIYEDHQVETSGAAEVRHHKNGMEIIPSPKPLPMNSESSTHGKDNRPRIENSDTNTIESEDRGGRKNYFDIAIRAAAVFAVFLLTIFCILLWKYWEPVKEVAENADLSDGVGDEWSELKSVLKQEIMDDLTGKEDSPRGNSEATAASKRRTAPKKKATRKK